MRKSVARVLTVISQEQKKALRDVYKNKVNLLLMHLIYLGPDNHRNDWTK